jgi:hypothetical protein
MVSEQDWADSLTGGPENHPYISEAAGESSKVLGLNPGSIIDQGESGIGISSHCVFS